MKAVQQFENAYGIRISGRKHLEILLLLLCVELVLACSYLGYLQIAPISVTTLHILVVVAGMLFGPWDATAVALVFAGTSIWKASVTSTEVGDLIFSPFLSGRPGASLLMAVGARAVFAFLTGCAFRWFFSKKRERPWFGISAISVIGTLLHSLLVYLCMTAFFGAGEVETSSTFDKALIANNLILYAVTVAVVLFSHRLFSRPRIRDFFQKCSLQEAESSRSRSRAVILLSVLIVLCFIFITMHFMNRLGGYIRTYGENVSGEYLSWVYALVLQFLAGFVGVFGLLSMVIRWIQEYYSALIIEANVRARENAEIANRSKSAFLFNMSHDIRTPMNAILGYTDIALRHADDEERVRDSLKKIKGSGNHLLNLINDILEMSRIESGKLELSENPLDIREMIRNVDSMSLALAEPKRIRFETVVGEIRTPYVLTDELHLNEVLINLISNAVKYTGEGGTVRFRIEQADDAPADRACFRFEISDNGIGMSEEFQQHLFESFTRENKAAVAKTEGAGLGLSIVKRIVELAGGSVTVRSRQGEGSAFTVVLPMKVLDAASEQAYRETQEENSAIGGNTDLRSKKILLVEDNEMNREIAEDILTEAGMRVESAEDGAVAVRTVKEKGTGYYDFILMDIQMPVMDGYTATAEIRRLPGGDRIPIIALSANAFKEDVGKSIAAGMNAHVAKPINVNALIAAMQSLSE